MVVARMSDGSFIIGVEDRNISMLTSDHPMLVDLRPHGADVKLVFMHKKTLDEVIAELKTLNKGTLPAPQPLPGEINDAEQAKAVIAGGTELHAAMVALTAQHGEEVVHMASMLANALHAGCIMMDPGLPEGLRTAHLRNVIDNIFASYIDVVELDRKLVYKVASGIHDAINRIQTDAVIASGALAQGEPHGSKP